MKRKVQGRGVCHELQGTKKAKTGYRKLEETGEGNVLCAVWARQSRHRYRRGRAWPGKERVGGGERARACVCLVSCRVAIQLAPG